MMGHEAVQIRLESRSCTFPGCANRFRVKYDSPVRWCCVGHAPSGVPMYSSVVVGKTRVHGMRVRNKHSATTVVMALMREVYANGGGAHDALVEVQRRGYLTPKGLPYTLDSIRQLTHYYHMDKKPERAGRPRVKEQERCNG